MPGTNDNRNVVRMHDYIGRRRKRKTEQVDLATAEMDEAMRTLYAAAQAAMKLVCMARHRLGMPQL